MPGSSALEGPLAAPRRGRGPGRRSCAGPAGPSQIWPLSRHHRRRGHRQQRAQLHRAVGALDAQRRGRGRHQLAQRDDVALRGHAPRTAGRRRPRRAPGRTVAGLVARDRSRTGTAGAGRPPRPGLPGGRAARFFVRELFPMTANLYAEQVQHVRRPVGDDRLHAEVQAQLRGRSGVLTVHTCSSWPERAIRARQPGWSRSSRCRADDPVAPDHPAQQRPVLRPARPASPAAARAPAARTRCSARVARSSSPAPASPAASHPKSSQQLDDAPLDQPGVPRGVLGLDRDLDRPVVVGDRLEQLAQRQHAVQLRVAVGGLVVEVGPGVLPRREVELARGRRAPSSRPRPRRLADAPQVAVVHADQVAVGGQPDVALERLGAGVERRRGRRARVCSAFSWLAPRWATTCGLMRPSVPVPPPGRCRRPDRAATDPASTEARGSGDAGARRDVRPSRDHAPRRPQPVRLRPARHRPGRRLPVGRRAGHRPRRRPAGCRTSTRAPGGRRSAPRPCARSTATSSTTRRTSSRSTASAPGGCGWCAPPTSAELAGIQLLPAHQGHGLGTHLIEQFLVDARDRGLPARLRVQRDNARARRLYDRLGFVEVGSVDGVDDPGDGEVLMEWRA